MIVKKEIELTDLNESVSALAVHVGDDGSDLIVSPLDKSVRGDDGGHGHGTAGEDREDSGETHCG